MSVFSVPASITSDRQQLRQPVPTAAHLHLPARPPARRFLRLVKSGTDPSRYGGSLYFSYGGDATLSQQRYEEVHSSSDSGAGAAASTPWQRAAPAFTWNRALAQPLLGACGCLGVWASGRVLLPREQSSAPAACVIAEGRRGRKYGGVRAGSAAPTLPPSPPSFSAPADAGMARFVPPVFMGFAGQITGIPLRDRLRSHTATVTLLARRSLHRAGTRQWRRGTDLQAAVANFVESEQVVVLDGGAVQASFVQVCEGGVRRGGVLWRAA